MRKKFLSMALACALSLSMAVPVYAAEPQTEIEAAAAYVREQGIMTGDQNGNLNLDAGLNRAELAVLLTRLRNGTEELFAKPLPLGRYKIVEVTAPAYWQLSGKTFDETLEYSGQIIKVSDYDKPSNLGVVITKRGNAEVLTGSQMRYDFTVANTSNVPLDSYYWHDRIPTDAARATVFTTGTYSARLNYRILYKTNYSGTYQVLASNLLTSSSYSFSLNAIPMQAGEYVTDIYLDFGKVPVGFQTTSNPTLTVQVLGTVANGYQIVNRADVGGKYQGTWQTGQASWVTVVRKLTPNPSLPKTGY